MYGQARTGGSYFFSRMRILKIIVAVLAAVMIGKLFYLQVIKYEYYNDLAESQHQGSIVLTAKRGDILLDEGGGSYAALATDIALDLVYVDPGMISGDDERIIAEKLAPLLFEMPTPEELEESKVLKENDIFIDESDIIDIQDSVPKPESVPQDSYEKLLAEYRKEVLAKIQQKEVNYVNLVHEPSPDLQEKINGLSLRGVFTTPLEIYADPTMIDNVSYTAEQLSKHLTSNVGELTDKLSRKPIRYMPLKRKVRPEVSQQIKDLDLTGVGLLPEHWRYYPENELAAQVIGYVDRNNEGQYGLEVAYNDPDMNFSLKGKNGRLLIDRDPNGNQIAVGKSVLTDAENGDSFVLTINRAVQAEVEKILAETVEKYDATAGQIIVEDPQTGYIIAMANYPKFNPNKYWEVFDTIEYGIDAGEYKNKIGADAFKNKVIADAYEPGSVFKVLTLVSALDAGEITPKTINCEYQDIVVIDNYRISNFDGHANGCITMTQVLERSSNLGALSVAQRLGKTLFYEYMMNFGMGQSTEINIGLENIGWVKKPNSWADIDLASAGFGQGIALNALQMTNIVSAVVNGGNLMKPIMIKKIIDGNTGKETEFKPTIVRRVVSAESAEQMKAMMVSVVEKGFGKLAFIDGFHSGGKTGTAQIAKSDGTGYESAGPGSTIASYVGFISYDEPKFVVLTKIDRPIKDQEGSNVSAPATKQVFEFLIDYYGIKAEY